MAHIFGQSTLTNGLHYGCWHPPYDVPACMDEIEGYCQMNEFWQDCTKGNLNKKNYTFEQLSNDLQRYESLLQASIRQLESYGWCFEPSVDNLLWREVEWL